MTTAHPIAAMRSLPPTAMQAPSGRWYLVGTFPVSAGYERCDGAPLTADDVAAITHCGPGFARACRTRTYETRGEALAAAVPQC